MARRPSGSLRLICGGLESRAPELVAERVDRDRRQGVRTCHSSRRGQRQLEVENGFRVRRPSDFLMGHH